MSLPEPVPPPAARPLVPASQAAPTQSTPADELSSDVLAFRLGLLVAAVVFFEEGLGSPFTRGIFGAAGLLVATLTVLTMLLQWRVLSDWRRRSHQVLAAGLALAFSWPMAAALAPSLGRSTLPDGLETILSNGLALIREAPLAGTVLGFLQGVLSFGFLIFTLGILLLGSGEGRRGGILTVGLMLAAICLFFYPSIETVAGFAFLGLFLANQWEVPLLMPDRLRARLKPIQIDYLRELVRQGALSTGETKVFLDNNPAFFAELLECRLVAYDAIAREIHPGQRLLHDPAAQALETVLAYLRRTAWIFIGLLYFVMPDLIPGPLDDIAVLLICTGVGSRIAEWLMPKRRG